MVPEASVEPAAPCIDKGRFDAVIFDMDGVITNTAGVHMAAWKRLFDDSLRETGSADSTFRPFTEDDYLTYVDGKPRLDGVRSFLASRGIRLPEGSPDDPPGFRTVHGLGAAKNAYFLEHLQKEGAKSYPHAVELVRRLHDADIRTAVISASRNAREVLASAGVLELFAVRVDGLVAQEEGLAGKPDPAIFVEAAARLGADPHRAVVVEDSQAGVAAGKAGGFGLVIGVDRGDQASELRARGADVVVADLGDVRVAESSPAAAGPDGARPIDALPSALGSWERIQNRLHERRLVVFLDYDGTLTPIVDRPEDAHLGDSMRAVLARLADLCIVFVVSGRDASFVVEEVALDDLWYMGSHGFDVVAPRGASVSIGMEDSFERFLPSLDEAEESLREALDGVDGVQVERKKYALAVHYRRVAADAVPGVEREVDAEIARIPDLRKSAGKRVFELRPDIEWDKGRAVCWALDSLIEGGQRMLALYVGDDVTDEDAFSALGGEGVTVVVGSGERETSAQFRVLDSAEVERLLELVLRTLDDGTAG